MSGSPNFESAPVEQDQTTFIEERIDPRKMANLMPDACPMVAPSDLMQWAAGTPKGVLQGMMLGVGNLSDWDVYDEKINFPVIREEAVDLIRYLTYTTLYYYSAEGGYQNYTSAA